MWVRDRLAYLLFLARKRVLWPIRRIVPNIINALDDPRDTAALCISCQRFVRARQYHLGFSDLTPLYCSGCGSAVFLDGTVDIGDLVPQSGVLSQGDYGRWQVQHWRRIEDLFQPCSCGGHYGYLQPPTCPFCSSPVRGDIFEGKPVLKQREGYCFLSGTFVHASEKIKPEHRFRTRKQLHDTLQKKRPLAQTTAVRNVLDCSDVGAEATVGEDM